MPDELEDAEAHNPIFDKIVGDDTDNLTKLIAYSLYKKRKRDFIIATKNREKRAPNNDEIDTYTNSAIAHIDIYEDAAISALDAYVLSVIREEQPNIEKLAITGRIEQAVTRLEGRGVLFRDFGVGILAWVASLFLLFLAAWAAQKFGIDLLDVLPVGSDS